MEYEYSTIGLFPHRSGYLSAIAIEEYMLETMPVACNVSDADVAQNASGCISDGIGTRILLRRLLLVSDGSVIRWGHHESGVDRRACGLCIG